MANYGCNMVNTQNEIIMQLLVSTNSAVWERSESELLCWRQDAPPLCSEEVIGFLWMHPSTWELVPPFINAALSPTLMSNACCCFVAQTPLKLRWDWTSPSILDGSADFIHAAYEDFLQEGVSAAERKYSQTLHAKCHNLKVPVKQFKHHCIINVQNKASTKGPLSLKFVRPVTCCFLFLDTTLPEPLKCVSKSWT